MLGKSGTLLLLLSFFRLLCLRSPHCSVRRDPDPVGTFLAILLPTTSRERQNFTLFIPLLLRTPQPPRTMAELTTNDGEEVPVIEDVTPSTGSGAIRRDGTHQGVRYTPRLAAPPTSPRPTPRRNGTRREFRIGPFPAVARALKLDTSLPSTSPRTLPASSA